jgi:predicted esterase
MNKQLPILICHGQEDTVVAFRFGKATAKYLIKKGYRVTFKDYPGLAHAVEPKELQDIRYFISQQLPSNPSGKL